MGKRSSRHKPNHLEGTIPPTRWKVDGKLLCLSKMLGTRLRPIDQKQSKKGLNCNKKRLSKPLMEFLMKSWLKARGLIVYDDEPLGFEKDPSISTKRIQAQDPLEEIHLRDGSIKRPAYISSKIEPELKVQTIEPLKEFRDCFSWDYNEMLGLSKEMVELKLPIRPDKKPLKQLPRRFAPQIMSKIKEEIERLLKSKFIRTARNVEWLANIVLVIKKNVTLRISINFRDLNNATPKDEYHMSVAEC